MNRDLLTQRPYHPTTCKIFLQVSLILPAMQRVSFRPQIGGIYPDIGRYTPVYTPKGRGYPVKFHWILICTNTMIYSMKTMALGLYGKS